MQTNKLTALAAPLRQAAYTHPHTSAHRELGLQLEKDAGSSDDDGQQGEDKGQQAAEHLTLEALAQPEDAKHPNDSEDPDHGLECSKARLLWVAAPQGTGAQANSSRQGLRFGSSSLRASCTMASTVACCEVVLSCFSCIMV